MTATQSRTDDGRHLGRRAFVKGIGATAAAGVGSKYLGSPVGGAQVLVPALLVGATVGAIAYGEIIAGPDSEAVGDSLTWQTHVNEFTRAREDELALEQTLASLERDIQLVGNKAREEAIFAIYEQGVDSGSEQDAVDAATAAIDETYAVVERAILDSWSIRASRAGTIVSNLGSIVKNRNHSALADGSNSIASYLSTPASSMSSKDHTDLAGNSMSYTGDIGKADHYNSTNSETIYYSYVFDPVPSNYEDAIDYHTSTSLNPDALVITEPDASNFETVDEGLNVDYTQATLINTHQWYQLLVDLYAAHSTVTSEVQSMVDTYYQPAADGEIDLHNMVGPAHLSDTASTAKDYQEATMALRAMGYPISDQVVTISVASEDDGVLELTGRLAWTAHSGNSLTVGEQLNPDDIVGSIFAAVNLPDGVDSVTGNETNTTGTDDTSTGPGAEIFEIAGPFTIESAEGASGVTFADRTLVEADSTLTAEEVQQIFKDNYEANKEATETVHDTATGGGGGGAGAGFFGGGSPDIGLIAAVLGGLGVVYALFVDDGGGS